MKKSSTKNSQEKKSYSSDYIESTLDSIGLTKKYMKKEKNGTIFTFLFNDLSGALNISQIYAAFGRFIYSVLGKNTFKTMEDAMISTGYIIVPHIYLGQAFLASIFVLVFSMLFLYLDRMIFHLMPISLVLGILLSLISSAGILFAYYYNPIQKRDNKARNIDINLPFALTHLSAISSAGSPPAESFRIFSTFEEFGSIREESEAIVKRIDIFGDDLTTALKNVRNTTPSERFKKVLSGMLTIINTGGSLNEYLSQMAEEFMFDYKIQREKYLDTLGTYADIYTAILIAAPLFLVAVLAVLNIIPDSTMPGGFTISTLLFFGVYILIPCMNGIFLAFVTFTQPDL
ncbi:MAG: type II secretion system F family protein [Candidatus Aenigmarchaeota archaeon]|nr:type II secretion system F family protein [Candidatus Aenigmarchaeota archaeon]MCK5322244.1 type II secretion system F family protein [Candidatus Aenigmarchaeota archaeon]